MKTTNDIADLQQTIDGLRKERFASLPHELIREIVSIEAEFVDNRPEAVKRIRDIVEAFLAKEGA